MNNEVLLTHCWLVYNYQCTENLAAAIFRIK